MTNLLVLGITFDFIGKISLVVMALLVHRKVRKEGKIDKKIIKEMKTEQFVGVIGLIFLVLGFLFEVSAAI